MTGQQSLFASPISFVGSSLSQWAAGKCTSVTSPTIISPITQLSFPPGTTRCFTINTLILSFSFLFLPRFCLFVVGVFCSVFCCFFFPPLTQGQMQTRFGRSWEIWWMRLPRYFVPDKICGAGHSWQSHRTSCLCSRDCAPLQLVPQRNQKQFKNRSAHNACHVGSGAKQGRDGGGQQHSHCTSKQAVAWWVFFCLSDSHHSL